MIDKVTQNCIYNQEHIKFDENLQCYKDTKYNFLYSFKHDKLEMDKFIKKYTNRYVRLNNRINFKQKSIIVIIIPLFENLKN